MTMIIIQLNNHNQWIVCVIYSSRAAALGLAARADSTNESLPVHPSFKQIPGFVNSVLSGCFFYVRTKDVHIEETTKNQPSEKGVTSVTKIKKKKKSRCQGLSSLFVRILPHVLLSATNSMYAQQYPLFLRIGTHPWHPTHAHSGRVHHYSHPLVWTRE